MSLNAEETQMLRIEKLLERREFLLSSVILRVDRHNIEEWVKWAELCKDEDGKLKVYMTALVELDPAIDKGKTSVLWMNLAGIYEASGSLAHANKVFWKAIEVEFKNPEELSSIYVGWAEIMIWKGYSISALMILRHAWGLKWL